MGEHDYTIKHAKSEWGLNTLKPLYVKLSIICCNCVIPFSGTIENISTSAIFGFHPPWPSCICRRMSTSKRHLTLSPCWKEWPSALSWRCSSACSPGWTCVSVNKQALTCVDLCLKSMCHYFLLIFLFMWLWETACINTSKHYDNKNHNKFFGQLFKSRISKLLPSMLFLIYCID